MLKCIATFKLLWREKMGIRAKSLSEFNSYEEFEVYLGEYRKKLDEMFNQDFPDVAGNEDRTYTTEVVMSMLRNGKDVRMFCGEMSVFTEDFYRDIDRELSVIFGRGSELSNDGPRKSIGQRLKEEMEDALKSFFSNVENTLDIYIQNYSRLTKEEIITKDLFKRAIKRKKLRIFKVGRNGLLENLNHFAIAIKDKKSIMRVENDPNSKKADVIFNLGQNIVDRELKNFDSLSNLSIPELELK